MMTSSLTMQVESRMGAVFISLFALFLAGVLFIAIKNFDSDQIVLDASVTQVKSMSSTERQLIAVWIHDNSIELPEGKGYNYIVKEYPDRPWLNY
jgi:hypothetical protein